MNPLNIKSKFEVNKPFTNWSKTFKCLPYSTFYPTAEEEIKQILELAKALNKKVKPVGSGLSPSDISCTQGFMVNLDNFNKVLQTDVENCLVKVQAGIKLSDIHKHLDKVGLAMSNLGSISSQTVAGVLGTAVHGTGINFPSISSQIVEITFYDGQAQKHVVKQGDDQVFKALGCNLGCLGIVTEAVIKVERAFNLKITEYPINLNKALDGLDKLLLTGEHVRFWWFPHVNPTNDLEIKDTSVWCGSRTESKTTPTRSNWLVDKLVRKHGYELLLLISIYFPSLVTNINQMFYNLFYNQVKKPVVRRSNLGFNFDCLFSQYVNEWAIPVQHTAAALKELNSMLSDPNCTIKAHFPVEVRFVKQEDILISPAYSQDVCYIGILMYRPFHHEVPYKEYWDRFENIMLKYNGKPHWAKSHPMNKEMLKLAYPQFDAFLEIRKRLDPHGLFVNDYIQRHLLD